MRLYYFNNFFCAFHSTAKDVLITKIFVTLRNFAEKDSTTNYWNEKVNYTDQPISQSLLKMEGDDVNKIAVESFRCNFITFLKFTTIFAEKNFSLQIIQCLSWIRCFKISTAFGLSKNHLKKNKLFYSRRL